MRREKVKKAGYFLLGDNRGASLIAVVVALVFVVTMGAIITEITTTNIRLRDIELSENKNFYNAETIMNELKSGMSEAAAIKMQEAYRDLLSYYPELTSYYGALVKGDTEDYFPEFRQDMRDEFKQEVQAKFNRIYADNLAVYFQGDISGDGKPNLEDKAVNEEDLVVYGAGKYDPEIVMNLMTEMLGVTGTPDPDDNNKRIFHLDDDSQVTLNINKDNAIFTIDYEKGLFALKNLKIEFLDNRSYETWISTDLVFDAPVFQFDDGVSESFMDYALIADDKIDLMPNSQSDVNGSVYAGAGGIESNGARADFSGDNIVTRGNIVVYDSSNLTFGQNSEFTETTHIWAQNVITEKKSGTTDPNPTLIMDGEINIEDDLALNSKNSNVTLKGFYNGYNFRENYSEEGLGIANSKYPATDSVFSSAIMINGENCNLDLSGLERLFIAGRTFISRGKKLGANNNKDILMGDSLSVRADQLAYLVSESYLETDGSGVVRLYPMGDTSYKYARITEAGREAYRVTTGVDLDALMDKYGADTIVAVPYYYRDYVSEDIKEPVIQYYLYFRFDMINRGNFTDSWEDDYWNNEIAKEFFDEYWNTGDKKDRLVKYGKEYVDADPDDPDPVAIKLNDATVLTLSGHLMYWDNTYLEVESEIAGLDLRQVKIAASGWDEPEGIYWERSDMLARTYKSLEDDLAGVYTRVDPGNVRFLDENSNPDKTKQPLFDNLIDREALGYMVDPGNYSSWTGAGVTPINDGTGAIKIAGGDWNIILCDNVGGVPFYIPADFTDGIVIATGDVQINKDINGMVISGGTIGLFSNTGVKVTGDVDLVKRIFKEIKEEKYGPKFYEIFRDYLPFDTDGLSNERIGDHLFYENWMKNEE